MRPTLGLCKWGVAAVSAFIVASVIITDLEKFKQYAAATAGLAAQYGGEYVVRGEASHVLEGNPIPGQRLVILRFPDALSAQRFYDSAAYQAAKQLRAGAADVTMQLFPSA
jgi:uncharacterized protein (DUF1330 family)